MPVRTEHVGDVAVVMSPKVVVTMTEVRELDDAVMSLLRARHAKILWNMSQTEFMSSFALNTVITALTTAKQQGLMLYFCGIHGRFREMLLTLKIGHWNAIHFDSCDEALKALQEA